MLHLNNYYTLICCKDTVSLLQIEKVLATFQLTCVQIHCVLYESKSFTESMVSQITTMVTPWMSFSDKFLYMQYVFTLGSFQRLFLAFVSTFLPLFATEWLLVSGLLGFCLSMLQLLFCQMNPHSLCLGFSCTLVSSIACTKPSVWSFTVCAILFAFSRSL